jgi:drug/metabolite transporter (DMT)-like permease
LSGSVSLRFAMIAMLSPLVTIYLAVIFLDEPFGWLEAAGTPLLVAGVGYFTFAEMRAA